MLNDIKLGQITSRHFCAAVIIDTNTDSVIEAAPILKYMIGWRVHKVSDYCLCNSWKIQWIVEDK